MKARELKIIWKVLETRYLGVALFKTGKVENGFGGERQVYLCLNFRNLGKTHF